MDTLRNVCEVTLRLLGLTREGEERAAAQLDKLHRWDRDVSLQVTETRLPHLSRRL